MQRTTLLLSLLFAAAIAHAQPHPFVRVYDSLGLKIAKGRILQVTDTYLQLQSKEPVTIPVEQIGFIRTKHSAGNNIAWGAGVSAAALAILLMATADDNGGFLEWTVGEGAAAGLILGAPLGAALGGLTALFKRSVKIEINGSPARLRAFGAVYNSPFAK